MRLRRASARAPAASNATSARAFLRRFFPNGFFFTLHRAPVWRRVPTWPGAIKTCRLLSFSSLVLRPCGLCRVVRFDLMLNVPLERFVSPHAAQSYRPRTVDSSSDLKVDTKIAALFRIPLNIFSKLNSSIASKSHLYFTLCK